MPLIVFAIVLSTAAGIWAEKRWPERTGHMSRRSLVLILYVLLPPVVFFNLVHVEIDADLGGGIVLGWIAAALATTLAWAIGSKILHLGRPEVGALMTCTLVGNTAYLGYPMITTLLGRDDLPTGVAFDIGVGAPALLIGAFAVGAAFGTKSGEGVKERTRAFFTRNVLLYTAIAALIAPDWMGPDVLVDISLIIVVAILPIGFFAVGATLMEDAGPSGLRFPPAFTKATAVVLLTKVVAFPLILIGLAAPFIDLPSAYLLAAAMPCGLNSMIVAHAYGLSLKVTAEAVTWTTAIVVAVAIVVDLL